MDLFSHALLPYLLGGISKLRKEYLAALVVGGIAPDFDIFIVWINSVYPNFFLTTHRGITHSLIFGFVTGVIILYLATRRNVKSRIARYVDFQGVFSRQSAAFAYAGVIIHLFLDSVTTRGVPLFYPIAATRYSAEVFFYTDTYLTIVSLITVIYLLKRPLHEHTAQKFLAVFLIVFAITGGIRIAEKQSAEDFFQGSELRSYPTMNAFEWYVLVDKGEDITIHKYNGWNGSSPYSATFSRLNVMDQGDALDSALDAAGELPQVKMLNWRAYAVAVNASFQEGVWSLEYYDPVRKAQASEAPSFVRRAFGSSLNVTVEQGKAVVVT